MKIETGCLVIVLSLFLFSMPLMALECPKDIALTSKVLTLAIETRDGGISMKQALAMSKSKAWAMSVMIVYTNPAYTKRDVLIYFAGWCEGYVEGKGE